MRTSLAQNTLEVKYQLGVELNYNLGESNMSSDEDYITQESKRTKSTEKFSAFFDKVTKAR